MLIFKSIFNSIFLIITNVRVVKYKFFFSMKKIISLLGLPGSGKSTYGKKFSALKGFKFIEESGTQLIYEKKYRIGINASFEFDRDVLKRNVKIGKEILQSQEIVIWEGSPYTDMFFLEERALFGQMKDKRKKLLKQYDKELFKKLHKKSIFIIFDLPLEIADAKQKQRGKPELITPDTELMKFVYDKLRGFRERNKEKVILIDASRSEEGL